MPRALFDKVGKQYAGRWANLDPIPHDPATQVVIEDVASPPSKRTDRWDGATSVRAATAPEIAVFDRALSRERTKAALDTRLGKVLSIVLFDMEQRLRAAGQLSSLPGMAAVDSADEYADAILDTAESDD